MPVVSTSRCVSGLPGVLNMRDLGGLATRSGGITRRGLVYRSAALLDLPLRTAATLMQRLMPITYVDLRSDKELATDGLPDALIGLGMRWVHQPVWCEGFLQGVSRPMPTDYLAAYHRLLDSALPAAAAIIRHIISTDHPSVIMACTAGKDRTGVVAALLLRCLDVPISVIASDYALSARYLRRNMDHFRVHWKARTQTRQVYSIRFEAVPVTMSRLLASLEKDESSIPVALGRIGLTEPEIEAFRATLCGPQCRGRPEARCHKSTMNS
jgi:protein-tyrosine phosphatase